ncbi:hypothetical protein EK21DRAFT_87752 [Setomelanomma holmii]|uniref:Uncharacterized protein n=1 Tax=Setomelanomma holmii TaxID=210430 RepID=A0A9P4HCG4_9PLEO|nr:hypothetical protein EK21DRAFT_87752 [Setomelanomma holmii]
MSATSPTSSSSAPQPPASTSHPPPIQSPKSVYNPKLDHQGKGNAYGIIHESYLWSIPIDHELARAYKKIEGEEERRAFTLSYGEKRYKMNLKPRQLSLFDENGKEFVEPGGLSEEERKMKGLDSWRG